MLTALHAGSASLGCYVLLLRGAFSLTKLSRSENAVLVIFSFLFTVNIAVSNVSLYESPFAVPFDTNVLLPCGFFRVTFLLPRDSWMGWRSEEVERKRADWG
jgi:hypothetical protein